MKKFMSIAVSVLLIACMACPVFAAGSNNGPVDIAAKGPHGETVTIDVSPATSTFAIPTDKAEEVDFGDGKKVPAGDLTVVYAQDLHSDVLPVTITFDVPAAGKTDILHVMHYNGSAWEQVAQATGSTVTATFKTLSPVTIVLQTVKSSSGSDTPTSPQTGADMTVLFAGILAFLAAGSVALIAKKTNA